ncbi:MAG: methyltransferase domain-containing protein [Chloroflexota bacterium]
MQSTERPEPHKTIPFDIWETSGSTEHLGGIYATQRLVESCCIAPGQVVLDIGCGTGYTASYLAQKYQARVVAIDISPRSVEEARKRVFKEGISHQVTILQADAHHLPFSANAFDTIVVESVLAFCDAAQVFLEMQRVLRAGGVLGVNELTLLKPPPEELITLLTGALSIQSFQEREWRSIFKSGGFVEVVSTAHRFNLWEQLASHIRVDGVRGYLSAMVKGLADVRISRVFINKNMLRAARKFLPFVGYGLYIGKKAKGIQDQEQGRNR